MSLVSKTPAQIGILTVSDRSSRGEREDLAGPALREAAVLGGAVVLWNEILPDEQDQIAVFLQRKCDEQTLDVILTTGGTGFAGRDVTPEATRTVIEREAPGLAEAIRAKSLQITPHAMLSRNIAGIRARTLIINFSGSPKAAVEQFEVVAAVLPHAVELLRGDPDAEAGH